MTMDQLLIGLFIFSVMAFVGSTLAWAVFAQSAQDLYLTPREVKQFSRNYWRNPMMTPLKVSYKTFRRAWQYPGNIGGKWVVWVWSTIIVIMVISGLTACLIPWVLLLGGR